ncbi:MAG: hypothetical protein ACOC2Q_03420 [Spirochaetota bacterium]
MDTLLSIPVQVIEVDTMSFSIPYLKTNSGLPGPRANLSLLHSFAESAETEEIDRCLTYCTPDVSNSPEGFLAMCGIVATPESGMPVFERLAATEDRHIRWIVNQNLAKNRLRKLNQEWVARFLP